MENKPSQELLNILKLYPSLSPMDRLKILLRLIFCVRPILTVLDQNLPKQGLILDLGCGYGVISHLISNINRKVIGIDVASHRIKVAKTSMDQKRNVEFYATDIREFQAPTCDAIIIIDVLYLFSYQDQEQILTKCYENLRNDGILAIKDSGKSPRWKYAYMYSEEWIKVKLGVYGDEVKKTKLNFWDSGDFIDLLSKIGFKITMIPLESYLPYPGVLYTCQKIEGSIVGAKHLHC